MASRGFQLHAQRTTEIQVCSDVCSRISFGNIPPVLFLDGRTLSGWCKAVQVYALCTRAVPDPWTGNFRAIPTYFSFFCFTCTLYALHMMTTFFWVWGASLPPGSLCPPRVSLVYSRVCPIRQYIFHKMVSHRKKEPFFELLRASCVYFVRVKRTGSMSSLPPTFQPFHFCTAIE